MKKKIQLLSILFIFIIFTASLNFGYSSLTCNNNFALLHFPTLLPSVMVNAPDRLDNKFTDMIKSTGSCWVVFEVDAYEIRNSQYAEQRLSNAIDYAKSQNLEIAMIYQQDIDHYSDFNLSYPVINSFNDFSNFIKNNNVYLAHTFIPDKLSIIAEPTLFSNKAHLNYSLNQWVNLLVNTSKAVKQSGYSYTNMFVAIDVIPKDKTDYDLSIALASKSIINGINYDVYGITSFSSITTNSNYQHIYGKKTGISEMWFKDIYTNPQYDNESYALSTAQYINSTYQIAKRNGFSSIYTPFFSEQFIDYTSLPLPFTVKNTEAYLQELNNRIEERTFIFNSYKQLIGSN